MHSIQVSDAFILQRETPLKALLEQRLRTVTLAAGKAWQTPFGMLAPVMQGAPVSSCAGHAVVLQLPLEGVMQGGGISAVLKRPDGVHPTWLTQGHNRNFFVSFAEVLCLWSCIHCMKS